MARQDGYIGIEEGGDGCGGTVRNGASSRRHGMWRLVVVTCGVVALTMFCVTWSLGDRMPLHKSRQSRQAARNGVFQSGLDQDTEGDLASSDSESSSLSGGEVDEKFVQVMRESTKACTSFNDGKLNIVPDCGSDMQRMRDSFVDENCGAVLDSERGLDAVVGKLRKLADDGLFVFFRGTAALFFNNLNCAQPKFYRGELNIPHLLTSGDAHPENFGTLMLANNKMTWGVNDFDHAYRSPFVVDVARGAAGFGMACRVMNETLDDNLDCGKVIDAWTRGYTSVFRNGACLRLKNSDRLIEGSPALKKLRGGKLVQNCYDRARKIISKESKVLKFQKKFVDVKKGMFVKSDAVEPVNRDLLPAFEDALQKYLFNGVPAMAFFLKENFFKLRDVAFKHGSGTGSLGLKRYYLLLDGVTSEFKFDRVILEMKEVGNSVMERYESETVPRLLEAKRASDSGRLAYPFANVFHGWVNFQNASYLMRRKSYWHKSVELDTISFDQLVDYASIAGVAQAHYHGLVGCASLSCGLDEAVSLDLDACNAVGSYLDAYPDFEKDVLDFAVGEIATEEKQYKMYKEVLSKEPMMSNPLEFLAPKRLSASAEKGLHV